MTSATGTNTLTVKMPASFNRHVASAAKARRISKSELTRRALEHYLHQPSATVGKPSILELAGDLVGCFKGPPDLATNPKYMEGFGED